ncbi:MAG: acyltransferase [Pseudomonadales bacterium]
MKLDHIDSLRGVAILMVILTHVGSRFAELGILGELTTYGRLGVQLFFVISALTLCVSTGRRANEDRAVLNFYIRRYFRIAPVYYMGGFIYFFVGAEWLGDAGVADYIVHSLFLHALFPESFMDVVPGGWSIGVEFMFYFLFPLIYFFAISGKSARTAFLLFFASIATSLIANFTLTSYFGYEEGLWNFTYWNFLNNLPVFLLGTVLYSIYESRLMKNINIFVVVGGFTFFTIVTVSLWKIQPRFYVSLIPITAAISFIFLYFVFDKVKVINLSLLRRIGQVSFSMYIFHFLVITVIFKYLPINELELSEGVLLLLTFFLTTFITLMVSIFSETYIEKPCVKLGSQIIEWLRPLQKIKASN